jgi:hypothetical protein
MAIITIPTITRKASLMHFPRNSCNTLLPPITPLRNRRQVGKQGPDDPAAETIHEVVDIGAYFVQRQVHASTYGGNLPTYRHLRLWMGCGTQQPQGSKEFGASATKRKTLPIRSRMPSDWWYKLFYRTWRAEMFHFARTAERFPSPIKVDRPPAHRL